VDWDSLLLHSQATSHSHTFKCRYPMFLPCSQCLGVTVSFLLKAIRVTLGGDQAPLLPLRDRPNIWTGVLTSLMGSAHLAGSQWNIWVSLCIWGPHPDSLGGQVYPLDQTVHWLFLGSLLPAVQGTNPSDREVNKTPPSPNPRQEPPEMSDSQSETGYWGSFRRK
jgi:hypothetical protein